jgi:hypothetical protein
MVSRSVSTIVETVFRVFAFLKEKEKYRHKMWKTLGFLVIDNTEVSKGEVKNRF